MESAYDSAASRTNRVTRWSGSLGLTLDARSASLFRITLALAMLAQLWSRWTVWLELSGPGGIVRAEMLPHAREIPYFPTVFTSLETFRWGVPVSLLVAAVIYTLLLIGWRTRCVTWLSLITYSTLAHRNPYLMIGADAVLGSMLLWSVLLPLGERFSLDARRRGHRSSVAANSAIVSLAAVGALLQIAVVYLATAYLKNGPTWWERGTALDRVLGMTTFRNIGAELLEACSAETLAVVTWTTLAVEWAIPALILCPLGRTWTRRAAIALMFGLHLGIACVLETGLFPVAMLSLTPLLLTRPDWDALSRRFSFVRRLAADAAGDLSPPASAQRRGTWGRWMTEAAAATLLCGLAFDNWNRNFAPIPAPRDHVLLWPWKMAGAPQRWEMFAPDAPEFDPIIEVELITTTGRPIRLWSNRPAPEFASSEPQRHSFLWNVLMWRATGIYTPERLQEGEALRSSVSRFFVDEAVRRGLVHPESVGFVEIWVTSVPTDSSIRPLADIRPVCAGRYVLPQRTATASATSARGGTVLAQ